MQKLFGSREFVLIWAAVVFICWLTGGWVAAIVIAAVLVGLILSLCRDTLPSLAILWTFLFAIGINRHQLNGFAPLISAVLFIVVGIVVNLIRFRPKFSFLGYKEVKATTVATLCFCAAVAFSGIAMKGRNVGAALIVAALALLLGAGYLFFSATIGADQPISKEEKGATNGNRMTEYVLFLMFVSGVIITLETVVTYARQGGLSAVKINLLNKSMDLGWGGPNNYSIIMATMIPATLYYAVKYGKYSPLFVLYSLLQFAIVVASGSRGSILFGSVVLTAALGYAVYKCAYRGRTIITVVAAVDICLIIFMKNAKEINEAFSNMMSLGLGDNGRIPLYQEAIRLFKWQPIFGVGFDYRLGGLAGDGYSPYWYHSTFFQALASTGIVGFLALAYLAVSRYRNFVTDVSVEKTFMAAGFLIFDLYALTDVFFFTPNGLLFLFIMTLAAEKTLSCRRGRPLLLSTIERKVQRKSLCKNTAEEKKYEKK